jgi:hypothetical protein
MHPNPDGSLSDTSFVFCFFSSLFCIAPRSTLFHAVCVLRRQAMRDLSMTWDIIGIHLERCTDQIDRLFSLFSYSIPPSNHASLSPYLLGLVGLRQSRHATAPFDP